MAIPVRTILAIVSALLLACIVLRRATRPPCPLRPPKSDSTLAAAFDAVSLPQQQEEKQRQQQPAVATARYGHEWVGGAVGYAERPGATEQRYAPGNASLLRAPGNASLLLLGVVSGSKNFDVRNWLRHGFWGQRPWRQGMAWRFVVGQRLPRGDNDRVSLHYEAARYGDLDLVAGSETPPRQARIAMRWWLHAASQASRRPLSAPRYAQHGIKPPT